jgi:tRNA/rRNA methyltransferase
MTRRVELKNMAVVLHRPRYPENIGAAARAMRNMGIERLVAVSPEDLDLPRVLKMATHTSAPLVERMEVFDDLRTALAPFQYVVGTTARLGGERPVIDSPGELARSLISISQKNRVALLFGPEDRGLTNADLRFCHRVVNIPTADFASLNLAQAVMVLCYEIFTAGRGEPEKFTPRLATRRELDEMYDQLRDVLARIHFINPENPDFWMSNVRRFFSRLQLRAREARMIRGLCRQIDWYGKKSYQDGLARRD